MSDAAEPQKIPPSPTTGDPRVAELIDAATFLGRFGIRIALGNLQREAKEAGNVELDATVRLEGNVFLIFEDAKTYSANQPGLRGMFFEADLPYLQRRATETPNRAAHARYLHAAASISRRKDDGAAAADAYLDAIEFYLSGTFVHDAEPLGAIIELFPLARLTSRRYLRNARFVELVTAFLTEARRTCAHGKSRILADVVADRGMKRKDLLPLRDMSIALIEQVAGGDEQAITALAAIGRRLADRIGEPYRAWYEGEVRGLEARLGLGVHPMVVSTIGARLLFLYEQLGDQQKVIAMRDRMREARRAETYETITIEGDGWSEEVDHLIEVTTKMVRDVGPEATLGYLSTTDSLMPSVAEVQASMDALDAEGIGSFSKVVSHQHVYGERLISTEHHEFRDHYDHSWKWLAVRRFAVIFRELCQSGELTIDQLASFLSSSWLGVDEHIPYGGDAEMPNDLINLLRAPLNSLIDLVCDDAAEGQLILAIDSLTLRMEAVFRKLARMLNELDTTTNDRGFTEALGLKALLAKPAVAELCSEDLIAFATHTLLREPEGLRHRIGHALLHQGQYHADDLFALVLLLLRLRALDVPEGS